MFDLEDMNALLRNYEANANDENSSTKETQADFMSNVLRRKKNLNDEVSAMVISNSVENSGSMPENPNE